MNPPQIKEPGSSLGSSANNKDKRTKLRNTKYFT